MDKIQGYCLLQQVVHILTTGLQRVSVLDNESSRRSSDTVLRAQQPSLLVTLHVFAELF